MSDTYRTSHGIVIGTYCGPAGPPNRRRFTITDRSDSTGTTLDLDVWQAEDLAHTLLAVVNGDIDPD